MPSNEQIIAAAKKQIFEAGVDSVTHRIGREGKFDAFIVHFHAGINRCVTTYEKSDGEVNVSRIFTQQADEIDALRDKLAKLEAVKDAAGKMLRCNFIRFDGQCDECGTKLREALEAVKHE